MRALFLDRDGVINQNRDDYVRSWSQFRFLPRSLEALHRLALIRYRVVVITNQSCINRGIVGREVVEEINRRMVQEVEACGGKIEAVFYCPHRPDENCDCRKPKPGLVYRARDLLGINVSKSFFVGDHISDIDTGRAAGCKASILVLSGRHQTELELARDAAPKDFYVAEDLLQAVELLDFLYGDGGTTPAASERG